MKLLGFVALYGFILAPVGAVIVFEYFFGKRFGIQAFYAEQSGVRFNQAVFWAWVLSFGVFYFISVKYDVFLSFLTLPAWISCGVLYLLFSRYYQRRTAG